MKTCVLDLLQFESTKFLFLSLFFYLYLLKKLFLRLKVGMTEVDARGYL